MKRFLGKKLTINQAREIQGANSEYCMGNQNTPWQMSRPAPGYGYHIGCTSWKKTCEDQAKHEHGYKLVAVKVTYYVLGQFSAARCYYWPSSLL